jgi:hypothetical protein
MSDQDDDIDLHAIAWELETEMAKIRADPRAALIAELAKVRAELCAEMEAEIKTEIANLKAYLTAELRTARALLVRLRQFNADAVDAAEPDSCVRLWQ